jgi:Ca-activated chloride channel family protein
LVLACLVSLAAQEASTNAPPPAAPVTSAAVLSIPTGEELVLELQDPINTRSTRKGAKISLTNTTDVLVNGRVVVPRGSTIHATVVESKRPGRLFGKAKVRLSFDEVELPDGTRIPLSAALSRAGWWGSKGAINQTVKGEGGKSHDIYTVGQGAAQGAIFGGIIAGGSGAARGAAAGAAVSALAILLQRGPDLDLPPGMMFEVELTQPLDVPVATVDTLERASEAPSSALPQAPEVSSFPRRVEPTISAASSEPAVTDSSQAREHSESAEVAANRTSLPPSDSAAPRLPSTPAAVAPVPAAGGGYVLKMSVSLVLVEATVRDAHGSIVDGLTRDDFRLLEDGQEQQIQYFSRDELPLAIALVVDRSGSVAPYLDELRDAADTTLSQLKPEDEVALFAFAAKPERLEYLTTDRRRIANAITAIQAGGGTNITDALFNAALYLGRAANHRRHAIILVSDNQSTVRGYASDKGLIRMALETETVIYSIRIGGRTAIRGLNQPLWTPGMTSVNRVTRETGGEIMNAGNGAELGAALATVISRLKQRYTLGYQSTNKKRDGSFRRIQVQLARPYATQAGQYSIYARRGYYAPMEHVAAKSSSD